MRKLLAMSVAFAVLSLAAWQSAAQQNQFPLAAPAGRDSNALQVAPPGAVNQGAYDMNTWKYGNAPAFTAAAGTKLWNPAKIKLMQGGKIVGGTVWGVGDPTTYCSMANAGYDFIWTEMQHASSSWESVIKAWKTCPHAKEGPGDRTAASDDSG